MRVGLADWRSGGRGTKTGAGDSLLTALPPYHFPAFPLSRLPAFPPSRLPAFPPYSDCGSGSGKSEFQGLATASQAPSACFFQITIYFPVSVIGSAIPSTLNASE